MAMNRRQTLKATAAGALATTLAGHTRGATPAPSTTTLWYRQPAATWTEALPIGNGVLGAMVFGGIGDERLQLNDGTLWAGQPYDPVNPDAKAALPQVRALIFAGKFAEAERLANDKLMARPGTLRDDRATIILVHARGDCLSARPSHKSQCGPTVLNLYKICRSVAVRRSHSRYCASERSRHAASR